jgi:hypothetical protein
MRASPLGHLQIAEKERCVHDAQDIFPGRQHDLLDYRTRPFVPLVFKWSMLLGGWAVPLWINWVALLVFVYLAYEGFRLARKPGGIRRD